MILMLRSVIIKARQAHVPANGKRIDRGAPAFDRSLRQKGRIPKTNPLSALKSEDPSRTDRGFFDQTKPNHRAFARFLLLANGKSNQSTEKSLRADPSASLGMTFGKMQM